MDRALCQARQSVRRGRRLHDALHTSDHGGTPNWQSRAPTGAQRKWDYYRSGFGLAAEQLTFAKAIDRAWPAFDDPIPKIDGQDRDLEHIRKVYAMLEKRDGLKVEKFRLGGGPCPAETCAVGASGSQYLCNVVLAAKKCEIRDLYADVDHPLPTETSMKRHELGLIVEYAISSSSPGRLLGQDRMRTSP